MLWQRHFKAERCKEGKDDVILIHLCGHGHFDLGAYEACCAGCSTTNSAMRRLLLRLRNSTPLPPERGRLNELARGFGESGMSESSPGVLPPRAVSGRFQFGHNGVDGVKDSSASRPMRHTFAIDKTHGGHGASVVARSADQHDAFCARQLCPSTMLDSSCNPVRFRRCSRLTTSRAPFQYTVRPHQTNAHGGFEHGCL